MAFQNLVFLAAIFYLASTKKSFTELEYFLIKTSFLWIFIDAFGDYYNNGFLIFLNWHNLETGGISGMLFCYSIGELISISKFPVLDIKRKRRLQKTASGSFFILLLSTSSGSNISVLIGLLALIFLGKNLFFKIAATVTMICFILFPDAISSVLPLVFPGKSMTGITSFGYRLHLWESFWELIKQKPVFGWGYASIERIGENYNIDAHNSLIGAIGGLGFFGGILLFLYIITIIQKTYKRKKFVGYSGLFSAFICLIANSNTFGFLSSKTTLLTISFFFLIAMSFFYYYHNYYLKFNEDRKLLKQQD